jgi:hypothetical protein
MVLYKYLQKQVYMKQFNKTHIGALIKSKISLYYFDDNHTLLALNCQIDKNELLIILSIKNFPGSKLISVCSKIGIINLTAFTDCYEFIK